MGTREREKEQNDREREEGGTEGPGQGVERKGEVSLKWSHRLYHDLRTLHDGERKRHSYLVLAVQLLKRAKGKKAIF